MALAAASPAVCSYPTSEGNHYPYPTTKLAGIDVIDTQIVRDARALVKGYGEPYLQKHVLRTWLFGAAMIQNNATLRASVDVEVHALATILHDLGWDRKFVSAVSYEFCDAKIEIDLSVISYP
jgi:hypothetical protein